MQNWFVWNKIVFNIEPVYLCQTEMFEIELFWHLNVHKQKTMLILNWIFWSRTVYIYKNGFGINDLHGLICHKTKPNQIKSLSILPPFPTLSVLFLSSFFLIIPPSILSLSLYLFFYHKIKRLTTSEDQLNLYLSILKSDFAWWGVSSWCNG